MCIRDSTSRVDSIYEDPLEGSKSFFLHYGDITDSSSVSQIISNIKPDEIYNLAAQSHVAVSFEVPEYSADVNGLGTFVMNEGHLLFLLMMFAVVGTLALNMVVQGFIG